jgi:hypothetical protein
VSLRPFVSCDFVRFRQRTTGHIAALPLQDRLVELDPALGHGVELQAWWRAVGEAPSPGPSLSYEVLDGDVGRSPAPPRASRASVGAGGKAKRRPLAPRHTWADVGLELVTTVERLHELKRDRAYVVNADNADGATLHRASCQSVAEPNFVKKVITNGMQYGEYVRADSPEVAREQWPGIREHDCI